MTSIGLPVPAGFTITTDSLRRLLQDVGGRVAGRALSDADGQSNIRQALETGVGQEVRRSTTDPLLVSVRSRSGAANSMPGMMDTVLNLGLNDEVGRSGIAERDRAIARFRLGRLPPVDQHVRRRGDAAWTIDAFRGGVRSRSRRSTA